MDESLNIYPRASHVPGGWPWVTRRVPVAVEVEMPLTLISRLLVRSVREESNQASVARLWRAAASAERLDITHVRARKTL